ncbi:MAG: OmpA family protein [Proteobacteria bacterium]|nr:OmpA family protein [Pseudomonadota bacterium]
MIVCALAVAGSACVGQQLRPEADQVQELIRRARRNGAYKCSARYLALAEVNLARTRDEMDLGNFVPAQDHLAVARENAKLAFDNSPPDQCSRPPDTDGDGIFDRDDQCPRVPEDKDGFRDTDGCPEADNDGDGIPDVKDLCPNHPEDIDAFVDDDGCPDLDNDNDGVPDALDSCPVRPEDHDGFEDEDGCPDEDNDKDNLPDLVDRCPDQAEDYDGEEDEDGCPDRYRLVVVTQTKLELKQKIHFATAKTRILPISFPLLNEVAQVLRDHSRLWVRIEGHTDSRGAADYNRGLSDGRANAVRAYLMGQGVSAERMEAIGHGEDRPIAANRTHAGRAANRRVEFFITRR